MKHQENGRIYSTMTALCGAVLVSTGVAAHAAESTGLQATCEAAMAGEDGSILWYESSLPEQAEKVIASFMSAYPGLEVEHVRSAGGQSIPAMIIQEAQANVRTADVASGTYDQGKLLNDRGLLADLTVEELGIANADLLPVPYGVVTANTFTAAIYNTEQINDDEVPSSWEGFSDEKWRESIGIFQRGGQFFAGWYLVWGEERTEAFLSEIVSLRPVLAASTFTLAEDIGAGVRPIGIGLYHTGLQVQQTGAPVGIEVIEPVVTMPLATYVLQSSESPLTSRCFAGWLVTEDGALAYEGATLRGNHLIEGTHTYEVLHGKELASWEFAEIERFAELTAKYNTTLSQ